MRAATQHVALLGAPSRIGQGFGLHVNRAFGHGLALGLGLAADTSTICAAPEASRWVKPLAIASCRPARLRCALQQRAGGGFDIGLAHQALADEEAAPMPAIFPAAGNRRR
jgi:hypothetical protein